MIYFILLAGIFWLMAPLLAINFAVTLTMLLSHVAGYDHALLAALVLGVGSDVLYGRPVGLTSLLLVGAVLVLTLLKKQFDLPKLATLAGGGLVLEWLYRMIAGQAVTVPTLITQAVVCLVFWRLLVLRVAHGGSVYLKG